MDTSLVSNPVAQAYVETTRAAMASIANGTAQAAPYRMMPRDTSFRSIACFPGVAESQESAYTIAARPQDSGSVFYPVPLVLGDEFLLGETDIAERIIQRLRSREFPDDSDTLEFLRARSQSPTTKYGQDMLVKLRLGDMFDAIKEREETTFDGVKVQTVHAFFPINPGEYQLEMQAHALHKSSSYRQEMAFAYSLGDVAYLDSRIVPGGKLGATPLPELNAQGKECYFDVTELESMREGSNVDVVSGNMVVTALPLVGVRPAPVYSDMPSFGSSHMMGGDLMGGGSIGTAAFTTGAVTGATSRSVERDMDPSFPITIVDVVMHTFTPDEVNDLVDKLH